MTTSNRTITIPFKTGTTAQNDAYKGNPGEITIDRTKRNLRIHDGIKVGGEELLRRQDLAEVDARNIESRDYAQAAGVQATLAQNWSTSLVNNFPGSGGLFGARKYANDASSSATLANNWATSLVSTFTGSGGLFGARKYANDAAASATTASGHATTATTKAGEAAGSATAAAASAGEALTSKNSTVAAANSIGENAKQVTSASEAIIAAWRASGAPTENLVGIQGDFHKGNVVDVAIYDTSKDSDGGAWRKRTKHTSWYNEPINGKWLGQKANELAARGDNLLAQPEEITAPNWSLPSGATVTLNTFTCRDGGKLDSVFAAATVSSRAQQQFNCTPNTLYAVSLLCAKGTNSGSMIRMYDTAVSAVLASTVIAWSNEGVPTLQMGATTGWLDTPTLVFDPKSGAYLFTGVYKSNTENSNRILLYPNANDGTLGSSQYGRLKINKVGELPSTYSASPELLVNGTFDLGSNSWTMGAADSIVDGKYRAQNGPSGGAASSGRQSFPTVIGKVYAVTGDITGYVGQVQGAMSVGIVGSAGKYGAAFSTPGQTITRTITFVAQETSVQVSIGTNAFTANQYCDFDNISVKEVTTLATPYAPYSQLAGSYYQNTTDGKFYALNSTYGQTEVFRGNAREFPAVAGIVAEATRVVIYDMTQANTPMWMVVSGAYPSFLDNTTAGTSPITSLAALNGKVFIGKNSTDAWYGGLFGLEFIGDYTFRYGLSTARAPYSGIGKSVAVRHNDSRTRDGSLASIVSVNVNDVAATVLQGAPIDPATGLPIPTVAVATAGGVSVIKHDGVVVSGMTTTGSIATVGFNGSVLYATRASSYGYLGTIRDVQSLSNGFAADFTYNSNPSQSALAPNIFDGTAGTKGVPARRGPIAGTSLGINVIQENRSTPAKSMAAAITNAYNTGWQVGDARGAWLSDIVSEVITQSGEMAVAANYIVTPTCDNTLSNVTDTGFTTVGGATVARVALGFATVIGRTYMVSAKIDSLTNAGNVAVSIRTGLLGNGTPLNPGNIVVAGEKIVLTFTATTEQSCVSFIGAAAGGGYAVSGISVRSGQPDRSVKSKGLTINGTLTKAPVAAGAELVGYSGFSASNYLEQPYDANLDFGTGDFCIMGWVNMLMNRGAFFDRGATGSPRITVMANTNWLYSCSATGGLLSTSVPCTAGLHHVVMLREAGVLKYYVDGVMIYSIVNTANVSGAVSTRLGYVSENGSTYVADGFMALWRASATAPSADQIAQIYREELQLFQPNAKATIGGTSASVTALAYDDTSDVLHVGTSWGRSEFVGLKCITSSPSAGAVTSLAAGQGAVLTGSAISGNYTQPAIAVREELRKTYETRRAEGAIPQPFWFTGDGTETSFTLPFGYAPHTVYKHGLVMREGSTNDYITSFDGYRVKVTFVSAPGINHNICILGVKNGN